MPSDEELSQLRSWGTFGGQSSLVVSLRDDYDLGRKRPSDGHLGMQQVGIPGGVSSQSPPAPGVHDRAPSRRQPATCTGSASYIFQTSVLRTMPRAASWLDTQNVALRFVDACLRGIGQVGALRIRAHYSAIRAPRVNPVRPRFVPTALPPALPRCRSA